MRLVPPQRVQRAAIGGDVREQLVTGRLRVDQRRRRRAPRSRRCSGRSRRPTGCRSRCRSSRRSSRSPPRCRASSGRRRCRPHSCVGVGLVGGRAHLRVAPEERVARLRSAASKSPQSRASPASVALLLGSGRRPRTRRGVGLGVGDVLRVVRSERADDASRRRSLAAVGGLRDSDRVGLAVLALATAEGHVDVAVAGDGDVRELDVVDARAELAGLREGGAVVGRAEK